MTQIEVKNLYKVFGINARNTIPLMKKGLSKQEIKKKTGCTAALNNVTFSINKGETFVIMGLSGSGKSTMIRCFNRLIKPTHGEILVDGQNVVTMDKEQLRELRRNKMSMVFQQFGLLPHRTVLQNVEFGLEIGGLEKTEREVKARKAIESVGLHGFEQNKPSELSGGMQQRVGLARALANDPEILLMDEAFSALDPLIRVQMQDELLDLNARMHKTIVFITHDLDEALKLGDRIAILGDGGIIHQIGTPEKILCDPADDYVKRFVQSVDRKEIITVSSIMRKHPFITIPVEGPETALRRMEKQNLDYIFITGKNRELIGVVTVEDASMLARRHKEEFSEDVIKDNFYTTTPDTAISNLLGTVMTTKYPIAVIDENKTFKGVVDRAAVIAEVQEGINDEDSPTRLREI
ncbi:MAG: glycine betaine/L-proline ABC transporter ATP-binding protein [Treponema sp.]|jgi:glycine betaine/proline transport system ATP-binding protein|nr:glycine betaine/L-proline ABC transporter ATP-binding protein [Treponema sp.]